MPSFRRRASVIDADRVDEPPQDPDRSADAADALALAEEAEAEAAEAEAIAAAARARARAIRLRRQAQAAGGDAAPEVQARAADVEPRPPKSKSRPPVTDAETEAADAWRTDDGHRRRQGRRGRRVAKEEPVRERRRWRLGRILKVLAAGLPSRARAR